MNNLTTRIEALERAMAPVESEPVEIHIYQKDCFKAGHDTPDSLSMVIKSGTPTRPGRTYHRQEAETETAFLERIEAEEVAAASQDAPKKTH